MVVQRARRRAAQENRDDLLDAWREQVGRAVMEHATGGVFSLGPVAASRTDWFDYYPESVRAAETSTVEG